MPRLLDLVLALVAAIKRRRQSPSASPDVAEAAKDAAREALLGGVKPERELSAQPVVPSPKGAVNRADLEKVLKGAVIAGLGVILARLADAVPGLDLGPHSDVVAAAIMVVLNLLRKLVSGPSQ